MPRGGARNRSGPPPDPMSGRSEARGYTLQSLPTKPLDRRRVPKFPLPERRVYADLYEDGRKVGRFVDEDETARVAEREAEMWEWAWRQPQAHAWILPSESFRIPMVAMWVRTFVICEGSDATAADKGSLHRLADQVGLTTAGLREMGWRIADDGAVEARPSPRERDSTAQQPENVVEMAPRRRLRGGA